MEEFLNKNYKLVRSENYAELLTEMGKVNAKMSH